MDNIVELKIDLPKDTIIKVLFENGVPTHLPTWVIATAIPGKFRILTEIEVVEHGLNPVPPYVVSPPPSHD